MKQVAPKPELPEEPTPPQGTGMTEKEVALTKENEDFKKQVLELQEINKKAAQMIKKNSDLLYAVKGILADGWFEIKNGGLAN